MRPGATSERGAWPEPVFSTTAVPVGPERFSGHWDSGIELPERRSGTTATLPAPRAGVVPERCAGNSISKFQPARAALGPHGPQLLSHPAEGRAEYVRSLPALRRRWSSSRAERLPAPAHRPSCTAEMQWVKGDALTPASRRETARGAIPRTSLPDAPDCIVIYPELTRR